jgi:nucleotide-binding universal stress UspA family protein
VGGADAKTQGDDDPSRRKEKGRMTEPIICGVDGSVDSRVALDVAARFAERLGARLVIAHVVDYTDVPYASAARLGGVVPPIDIQAVEEAQKDEAEQLLAQVAEEAGLADTERRIVMGFPAERLSNLADDVGALLIVVGSRGRGGLKTAILGSVSNSLVGIARCPVLIVPRGASER